MTNGTVQKGSRTSLVVQYQDGSKTISVPANVPVMEVVPAQIIFAVGDMVYAATEKLPNGRFVTDIPLYSSGVERHQVEGFWA